MSADRVACDEMEALAPELALGTLTGAERADAVGHLASCVDCQLRVSELARIADSLLLLAPAEDPTDELEARVLSVTNAERAEGTKRRHRIPRRRALLAACLTAAAAVAVALGIALFDGGDHADAVRTALAVEDDGQSICRAVINETDPAWLFVSLDEPGWRVRQGQAVWHPPRKGPEITGEILLAESEERHFLVQFSKGGFPLAVAQITPQSWQLELPAQSKRYAGRGRPPARLLLLSLPAAVHGEALPLGWSWNTSSNGGWRLNNPRSGELLEGYFNP